jgi:carboxyl-terminal processing protease
MNTKSWVQMLSVETKGTVTLAVLIFLAAFTLPLRAASSPDELLEKGIYVEETKGDLKAAKDIYQQIVNDPAADRALAAQAQLRLGLCELKLGNKPQAVSALDRLTLEFPDKDRLVEALGQHVPQLLDEMIRQIEQNYVLEVDRSELMEAAIQAIVGKLGANGGLLRTNDMAFLDANEVKEANANVQQKIAGIGAMLRADPETHEVILQDLYPGSPAIQSGLHAGDRIMKINGAPTPINDLKQAVELLRGPVGTTVSIAVKREGSSDLLQLELRRDVIRLSSVSGYRQKPDHTWDHMLDDQKKIGYIRVTYSGAETLKDMVSAITELKARGLKALILDLRDDPGGLLDSAVAVSDLFVDEGKIVTVKSRNGEKVYKATKGGFTDFPMAVLVSRNTASAAEIIAACLQDHRRAIVVGERTLGQGLVKSLIQLKDGAGALKIPVGTLYRPNGNCLNRYPTSKDSDEWGVQPDPGNELALSDDDWRQSQKNRSEGRAGPGPAEGIHDPQLQLAVEALQGQLDYASRSRKN